jgi:hypothetical protein
MVTTNDSLAPRVVLSASGFSGVEVTCRPRRVNLTHMIVDREIEATCFLKYTGEWEDIEIGVAETALEGVKLIRSECLSITPELARELSPTTSSDVAEVSNRIRLLKLVFFPTGKVHDDVKGEVVVSTNIPRHERFTLPVKGRIVAPIEAFPNILDFGEVEVSEELKRTVVLVSRLGEAVEVVGIEAGPRTIHCEFSLLPGTGAAKLTFRAKGIEAIEAAETPLVIRARLTPSGEQTVITLPIAAWPSGVHAHGR